MSDLDIYDECVSGDLEKLIRPFDLFSKLFWFGNIVSCLFYLVLAFVIGNSSKELHAVSAPGVVSAVFALLASLFIAGSFIYSRIFLSPKAIADFLDGKPSIWFSMAVKTVSEKKMKGIEELSETEKRLAVFARLSSNFFGMQFSFLNTVGIFGLVLSILILNPYVVLPFVTVAILFSIPQMPVLKKVLESGLREYCGRVT